MFQSEERNNLCNRKLFSKIRRRNHGAKCEEKGGREKIGKIKVGRSLLREKGREGGN